jgi:predicted DNA-binding transcriptional regulator YafY
VAQTQVLLRNILIVNKIKNDPYIGLSELVDYIDKAMTIRSIENTGLSRRTILRDIQNIQTDLGIFIQYSRHRQGYFIEDCSIRSDVEQFLDSFDVFTALNMDAGVPNFVFAEKHRPRGTQHLFPLIQAIKNVRQIRFSYEKFQGEDFSERHLEPYALKEVRGRWYVVGCTAGQKALKSYGLDRISHLEITDRNFKKDTSVDITEKFKHSYGIYSSDEYPVEEVILSFDAEDGRYLKSLPLHPTQEIIKDDEDEFVIRLHIRITEDFIMEIMSRSWSLKVMQPTSLQKRICGIYQSALERHLGSKVDILPSIPLPSSSMLAD